MKHTSLIIDTMGREREVGGHISLEDAQANGWTLIEYITRNYGGCNKTCEVVGG